MPCRAEVLGWGGGPRPVLAAGPPLRRANTLGRGDLGPSSTRLVNREPRASAEIVIRQD
jgi:hypothetical protein